MTPAWAATRAPSPILRWSAIPACPASTTPSPISTLPATPTWATITQSRPTRTLWPMCTRLSILLPRPTTVSPSVPRSTVQFAPISTSSSIRHPPTCGTFTRAPASPTYPKPSVPSRAPGWTRTRSPRRVPCRSEQACPILHSRPISTPSSRRQCAPIREPAPTRTPRPSTAPASTETSSPISTCGPSPTLGWMAVAEAGSGYRSSRIGAMASCGSSTRMIETSWRSSSRSGGSSTAPGSPRASRPR